MADEPTPTYRVVKEDDTTPYVCVIPYAGREGDICGWWSADLDGFTQHMNQQHAGVMVAEPAPKGDRPAQAAVRQAKAAIAEKQDASQGKEA
jgi:hypothetical protein